MTTSTESTLLATRSLLLLALASCSFAGDTGDASDASNAAAKDPGSVQPPVLDAGTPPAQDADLVAYEDAECTTPIAIPADPVQETLSPTSVGERVILVEEVSLCPSSPSRFRARIVETTERVERLPFYQPQSDGRCWATGIRPVSFRVESAETEDLVEGRMHLVDGGDGLAGRVIVAEEGSFQWGTLGEETVAWSTRLEATMRSSVPHEELVLEAVADIWTRPTSFFTDDDCTERAAVRQGTFPSCRAVAARRTEEDGSVSWFRTGDVVPMSEVKSRTDTGDCVVTFGGSAGTTLEFHEVGVPLDVPTAAPITLSPRGEGRLRTLDALDPDGDVVARNLSFWDTELETRCVVSLTSAGGLRCMPPYRYGERTVSSYYADDACEETPLLRDALGAGEGGLVSIYDSSRRELAVGGARLGEAHAGDVYGLRGSERFPVTSDPTTFHTITRLGLERFAVLTRGIDGD